MSWHYVLTNQTWQLSGSDIKDNGDEIYTQLREYGWSVASISALMGNITLESGVNPAQRQQGYNADADSWMYSNGGYGLVQWTGHTDGTNKYYNWCCVENNYDVYSGERQIYAISNNSIGDWSTTGVSSEYSMAYSDFKSYYIDTTLSGTEAYNELYYLSAVFEECFERGTPFFTDRADYAKDWWDYYTKNEITPEPSEGQITARKVATPSSVEPSDSVAFDIFVYNTYDYGIDVTITDQYNRYLTPYMISDNGIDSGSRITWNVTVPANGQIDVVFMATVSDAITSSMSIENSAEIDYEGGTVMTDIIYITVTVGGETPEPEPEPQPEPSPSYPMPNPTSRLSKFFMMSVRNPYLFRIRR